MGRGVVGFQCRENVNEALSKLKASKRSNAVTCVTLTIVYAFVAIFLAVVGTTVKSPVDTQRPLGEWIQISGGFFTGLTLLNVLMLCANYPCVLKWQAEKQKALFHDRM